MHASCVLSVDDLVRPTVRSKYPDDDGRWTVSFVDARLQAGLTAADAHRIELTFAALRVELAEREARLAELAAVQAAEAERLLDRAFGAAPAPWPVGAMWPEAVASVALDGETVDIGPVTVVDPASPHGLRRLSVDEFAALAAEVDTIEVAADVVYVGPAIGHLDAETAARGV